MRNNPFQSPRTEFCDEESTRLDFARLKRIAYAQQYMMVAAFATVLTCIAALAATLVVTSVVLLALILAAVAIVGHLATGAFAFRLAANLYNPYFAVLVMALVAIPVVGLLVVRILDHIATQLLERHGVGFG